MNTRHDARLWAVQFLFQREFNLNEMDAALADFWAERKPSDKVKEFTEQLINGVLQDRPHLDELLQKYAQNWEVKRMGAVERNIMRLSLFEMLKRDDIPPVVSINEAVELAKELSSDESGRFVNGILDRARKDLDRPARAAVSKPST